MFKEILKQTIETLVSDFTYQANKQAPNILLGAGIIGILGGTVLACRATVKAKDVVEEASEEIEEIHEKYADQVVETPEGSITISTYDPEYKKELTHAYMRTGWKLAKLYALPVALEGAGIYGVTKSNSILNDRYVKAATAFTALKQMFDEQQKRIVKKFGAEAAGDIRHGYEEVEETVVDEKGKKKKAKKKVKTGKDLSVPQLDFDFDRDCKAKYDDDHEIALYMLKLCESMFEEKRIHFGHVFQNEVRDALGKKRTKAGNTFGWFYDKNDPYKYPRVDFGVFGADSEHIVNMFRNYEIDSIPMHFNCIDILSGLDDDEAIDDANPEVA